MKNESKESILLKALGADPSKFKEPDSIRHKIVVDTQRREIDY